MAADEVGQPTKAVESGRRRCWGVWAHGLASLFRSGCCCKAEGRSRPVLSCSGLPRLSDWLCPEQPHGSTCTFLFLSQQLPALHQLACVYVSAYCSLEVIPELQHQAATPSMRFLPLVGHSLMWQDGIFYFRHQETKTTHAYTRPAFFVMSLPQPSARNSTARGDTSRKVILGTLKSAMPAADKAQGQATSVSYSSCSSWGSSRLIDYHCLQD